MNRMTLLKAIGNIDDKYIVEAVKVQDNEIKLINIEQNKPGQAVSKKTFKQYIPVYLAAAAALILLVIGVKVFKPVSNNGDEVMVVSPMQTVDTLAEAEGITGFGLEVPESIKDTDLSEITVIAGDTIQADYAKNDEVIISIRKAKGNEDISGDYNTYDQVETIDVNGNDVTIEGSGGTCYLATWTDNGYSYSFSVFNGMSKDDIVYLIEKIK